MNGKHFQRGVELRPVSYCIPVPSYRIGCTCGWVGCWYQTQAMAAEAQAAHAERLTLPYYVAEAPGAVTC